MSAGTIGYISSTQVTVTVPAGITFGNTYDIVVNNGTGTSAQTSLDHYTYTNATANVTSVFPTFGPTSGGTPITLSGTNLSGVTSVTINGASCYSVSPSYSQVTCTTGTTFTTGSFLIYVNGVATGVYFTYGTGSTGVTSVFPTSGPTSGGTPITLSGTNLSGVTSVTINGASCYSVSPSYSQVTCTTGTSFTTGTFLIYVNGTPTGVYFTYGTGTTGVTSVSPTFGPTTGGTQITLSGTNLLGVATVSINGVACYSVAPSYFSVTCITGASYTSGTFPIVVNGVTSGVSFTYGFGTTGVTSVSPTLGPTTGGTFITLSGTNLSGVTSVTINGASCYSVVPTLYSATCTTGASTTSGTYPIYVNGVASGVSFTYGTTGAPVVTSVSPTSGSVGTLVTIYGSGFTGATSVTFGGVSASFTFVSDSQISATVPSVTSGTIDVSVTTANGTSTNTSADNFTVTSTATTYSYTLYVTWTLISWNGASGADIGTALQGSSSNSALNNIYSRITAIWFWDAANQNYKGWFPSTLPGASTVTTFTHGAIYWVAITSGGTVTWTIAATTS